MAEFCESELCQSILNSLPTGICLVDLQKRIVLWSEGAERLTGRLRHEVIGHSCVNEALLQCDQPGCEFCSEDCPLARAIKTAQSTEAIGFLHHKAGHEIPVRVRAVPVRNARGSIIGAVETFEEQQIASPEDRENALRLPGCMDQVTHLASQLMMRAYLLQTLATFQEVSMPLAVLLFRPAGLEHFRASFGPEACAMLLRALARTLESGVWRTDILGRWGEDEFLVILNGCSESALHAVRDRLRRLLADNAIEWWGERHSLPVAIGQTMVQAGDTLESLMERAHRSLDAASAGLARAASASPSPSAGS